MAAGVVERWAPLGLAAMALVLVLLLVPSYESRLALQERAHAERIGELLARIDRLESDGQECRQRADSWAVWSSAVYERLDALGWRLPNPPKEARP